ncbi:Cerato-platanin-domain-containing protein [Ganoderma leucocontextum]|nr:Cerato-platanin-domain-containing protein [Ganoderma leucocontextum]
MRLTHRPRNVRPARLQAKSALAVHFQMSASAYPLYWQRSRMDPSSSQATNHRLRTTAIRPTPFTQQDHAAMHIRAASHALLASLATIVLFVAFSQARFTGHGPVVTSRNVSVSYDTMYDNGRTSLSTVACSHGSNGMMTKGYTSFSSIPSFPYIGGADVVEGYNSTRCGECWRLVYETPSMFNVIYITLIDSADGWSISAPALDDLTNGEGEDLGQVDAVATLMPQKYCGM